MNHFERRGDHYYCEGVPLAKLADAVGTPAYIYSRATLERHARRLRDAFAEYPTLACFAVKANSNLSLLNMIFNEGYGADLVSMGELERALKAGVKPDTIVFSGVGKRLDEIQRALQVGILSFNVESAYELETISSAARALNKVAPICLRVNPNIDAKTNEKIATGLYSTKFGLPETELSELLTRIRGDKHLSMVGMACHIGSQIVELSPLREAAQRMAEISRGLQAQGLPLKLLNMGGGLGIRYRDETPPSLEDYAKTLLEAVRPTGLKLVIEPGRVLIGNVGVLLTRVQGVKRTSVRHFVVLDAAMNDLVRPSLYEAYHEIEPVRAPGTTAVNVTCDFVGPICETGDYLGKNREVPLPSAGDLFLIRGAGAYGSSMASQYNSRPRAPEVLVDGDSFRVIRPREDLSSLWTSEIPALDAGSKP